MLDNLYVVDNFYEDPNSIRNVALHVKYLKFGDNANYPGYESLQAFYTQDHAMKFEELMKRKIYINPDRYIYEKFRYSPDGSKSYSDMHIDSPDWAAMIYLTSDKDCKGGLGIYRHKNTGIFKVPQNREKFKELGYEDFYDMDRRLVVPETKNLAAWELIELIPMRYNRLVLFKGSMYFHSITEKFGTTVEDSRLTHSFFFNEK